MPFPAQIANDIGMSRRMVERYRAAATRWRLPLRDKRGFE
jgi:hypothetical protein